MLATMGRRGDGRGKPQARGKGKKAFMAEVALICGRPAMEHKRPPGLPPYPIEALIDVESLDVLLGPPSMRIDVVAPSTSIAKGGENKFERLGPLRSIWYAFTIVICGLAYGRRTASVRVVESKAIPGVLDLRRELHMRQRE